MSASEQRVTKTPANVVRRFTIHSMFAVGTGKKSSTPEKSSYYKKIRSAEILRTQDQFPAHIKHCAQNPSNQPYKHKTTKSSYSAKSKQRKLLVGLLFTHSDCAICYVIAINIKPKLMRKSFSSLHNSLKLLNSALSTSLCLFLLPN